MTRSSAPSRVPLARPVARWATVAAATVALAGAGAVVVVPYVAPPTASAAAGTGSVERSLAYLEGAQNKDGGFPAGKDGDSDPAATVWAALALEAVGVHPKDRSRKYGEPSAWDYLKTHAKDLQDTSDLARLLMVVGAGGGTSPTFGGVDLVQAITQRGVTGTTDGVAVAERSGGPASVEATAWTVLAFKAAADLVGPVALGSGGAQWLSSLVSDARPGWGATPDGPQRVDVSALALQAVHAFRPSDKRLLDRRSSTYEFLRENAAPLGGFRQRPGGSGPDAYTTALAIQAYRVVGVRAPDIDDGANSATWLLGQQAGSGAYGTVRTTAQVLSGLNGTPYPPRPVEAKGQKPPKKEPKKDEEPKTETETETPSTPPASTPDPGPSSGTSDTSAAPFSGAAAGSAGNTPDAAPSSTPSAEASGPRGTGGDQAQQQEQQQKTQTGPTPPADGGENVTGTVVGGVQDEQDAAAPGLKAGGGGDDGGSGGVTAGLGGGVLVMAALGALLEARRPRSGSVLGEAPALGLAGAAPAGPAAAAPEAATAPAEAPVPGTAPADAPTAVAPTPTADAPRPGDAPHGPAGVRGPNPAAG